MNTIMHPEIEELAEYLEQPENDRWMSLREHLSECSECRKQVSLLQQSLKQFNSHLEGLRENTQMQHLSENEIIKYCTSFGRKNVDTKITEHIEQCDKCRYRALSYQHKNNTKTHDDKLSHSLQETKIESVPDKLVVQQRASKLYQSIAAVVVVFTLAALLPYIYYDSEKLDEENNVIAAFTNNQRLQFFEGEQGSRSFMGQKIVAGKEFEEPRFSLDDKQNLKITWQKVENSTRYNVKVFSDSDRVKDPIVNLQTQDTSVQVSNIFLERNRIYYWEISGVTNDNRQFLVDGGLVMTALEAK